MSVVAVIAEYNPFHNGHAYQLARAKELTGADHALVIMSGDFVQRGSAAIMDKYLRTEMALKSGADCVLELPVWMATGPAMDFARGGVRILNALGCVDYLCFGAESADLTSLKGAASIFNEEPEAYKKLLKSYLRSENSYAQARQLAYEAYTGLDGSFLKKPNNILAISYLQALSELKSSIKPIVVHREGNYHDQSMDGSFASATAIRNEFRNHNLPETSKDYVPAATIGLYEKNFAVSYPIDDYAYWPMLKIKMLENLNQADTIYDFPMELANRFEKNAMKASDYCMLVELLASPSYTNTRIHRGLLHLLLDLRERDVEQWKSTDDSLYARVLGFREDHSSIVGQLKKSSSIPVLTKALADQELEAYPAFAVRSAVYAKDVFAANLYSMLMKDAYDVEWVHEYRKKLIKVT